MPALDGLRAVAILLVIAIHVAIVAWPNIPYLWSTRLIGGFGHGVQLFFVVSAFTLALRFRPGAPELKKYAIRRFARIAPAFWLAAAAYGLLSALGVSYFGAGSPEAPDWLVTLVFANAWVARAHGGLVPGGWSISCEVAFYCVLPVCMWLINGRVWRALALASLCIIAAQIRAREAILAGLLDGAFVYNPIEQLPVFLLGVAAAVAVRRYEVPRLPGATLVFLTLAIVVVPLHVISDWYLLRHIQFGFAAALAVVWAAFQPPPWLVQSLLRTIGQVSFSMYLVHWVLLYPSLKIAQLVVGEGNAGTTAITMVVCSVASYAFSLLTYRLIEQPAIEWATGRTRSGSVLLRPGTIELGTARS